MTQRRIFGRRRRSRKYWVVPILVLLAGLAAFVAAKARDRTSPSAPLMHGVGAAHIHGFGVNPRDGALFIATHTGLFRQGPRESAPARVGESHQDTMGFAVVGADDFVGSGHPDVRASSPPLLGLVQSSDAGRTWEPISLLGQADFHVLRVVEGGIVGYDATNSRVMVSRDAGTTWTSRRVRRPLVDLVSDAAARVLLATTESHLIRSGDGGASWTTISEAPGLLSWPRPNRLYLLAGDGRLWRSPDQGRRWVHVGEVGGQPTAFLVHGTRMYAALHDGSVKQSGDSGRTWRALEWSV